MEYDQLSLNQFCPHMLLLLHNNTDPLKEKLRLFLLLQQLLDLHIICFKNCFCKRGILDFQQRQKKNAFIKYNNFNRN